MTKKDGNNLIFLIHGIISIIIGLIIPFHYWWTDGQLITGWDNIDTSIHAYSQTERSMAWNGFWRLCGAYVLIVFWFYLFASTSQKIIEKYLIKKENDDEKTIK